MKIIKWLLQADRIMLIVPIILGYQLADEIFNLFLYSRLTSVPTPITQYLSRTIVAQILAILFSFNQWMYMKRYNYKVREIKNLSDNFIRMGQEQTKELQLLDYFQRKVVEYEEMLNLRDRVEKNIPPLASLKEILTSRLTKK